MKSSPKKKCVFKAAASQNAFSFFKSLLCFDTCLNPRNVKNRGPILKGALDTLNAALHLWRSSWLQHRAKSGTTRWQQRRNGSSFLHTSSNMKYAAPAQCSVHLCGYVRVCATHSRHAWEMCGGTVYLQSMIIVSVSLSLASWKGGCPQTSMKRITPRLQISADTQGGCCLVRANHHGT